VSHIFVRIFTKNRCYELYQASFTVSCHVISAVVEVRLCCTVCSRSSMQQHISSVTTTMCLHCGFLFLATGHTGVWLPAWNGSRAAGKRDLVGRRRQHRLDCWQHPVSSCLCREQRSLSSVKSCLCRDIQCAWLSLGMHWPWGTQRSRRCDDARWYDCIYTVSTKKKLVAFLS